MPGNRLRTITAGRRDVYEALKGKLGKTRAARSRMAKAGARTRKRKG